jgi:hypothetical protein
MAALPLPRPPDRDPCRRSPASRLTRPAAAGPRGRTGAGEPTTTRSGEAAGPSASGQGTGRKAGRGTAHEGAGRGARTVGAAHGRSGLSPERAQCTLARRSRMWAGGIQDSGRRFSTSSSRSSRTSRRSVLARRLRSRFALVCADSARRTSTPARQHSPRRNVSRSSRRPRQSPAGRRSAQGNRGTPTASPGECDRPRLPVAVSSASGPDECPRREGSPRDPPGSLDRRTNPQRRLGQPPLRMRFFPPADRPERGWLSPSAAGAPREPRA